MSARGGKKRARVGVDAEGGKHEWHENTIFPPPLDIQAHLSFTYLYAWHRDVPH